MTIFEKLFVTGEADVVAQLQSADKTSAPQPQELKELERRIAETAGIYPEGVSFRSQLNLVIDRNRLLVYRETERKCLCRSGNWCLSCRMKT